MATGMGSEGAAAATAPHTMKAADNCRSLDRCRTLPAPELPREVMSRSRRVSRQWVKGYQYLNILLSLTYGETYLQPRFFSTCKSFAGHKVSGQNPPMSDKAMARLGKGAFNHSSDAGSPCFQIRDARTEGLHPPFGEDLLILFHNERFAAPQSR